MGKKKDKKKEAGDPGAELKRLRKENADLRKRLRKIADLASEAGDPADDVDEEVELIVPATEDSIRTDG